MIKKPKINEAYYDFKKNMIDGDKHMLIKKIGIDKLDQLIDVRIKVLRSANKLSDDVDMEEIASNSYNYYKRGFQDDSFIIFFAYEEDKVIGCGGVSFYEVMSTFDYPNGRAAYIMNMYTEQNYRKKGIATKILDCLVNECLQRGIDRITLEASDMGLSVYEKYGFVKTKHEMIYK